MQLDKLNINDFVSVFKIDLDSILLLLYVVVSTLCVQVDKSFAE